MCCQTNPGNNTLQNNSSKDISPKVNLIAWLEFKLIYQSVAVKHVNPYGMEIPIVF